MLAMQVCRTYAFDGFCPYGSRCRFRHDASSDGATPTASNPATSSCTTPATSASGGSVQGTAAPRPPPAPPPPLPLPQACAAACASMGMPPGLSVCNTGVCNTGGAATKPPSSPRSPFGCDAGGVGGGDVRIATHSSAIAAGAAAIMAQRKQDAGSAAADADVATEAAPPIAITNPDAGTAPLPTTPPPTRLNAAVAHGSDAASWRDAPGTPQPPAHFLPFRLSSHVSPQQGANISCHAASATARSPVLQPHPLSASLLHTPGSSQRTDAICASNTEQRSAPQEMRTPVFFALPGTPARHAPSPSTPSGHILGPPPGLRASSLNTAISVTPPALQTLRPIVPYQGPRTLPDCSQSAAPHPPPPPPPPVRAASVPLATKHSAGLLQLHLQLPSEADVAQTAGLVSASPTFDEDALVATGTGNSGYASPRFTMPAPPLRRAVATGGFGTLAGKRAPTLPLVTSGLVIRPGKHPKQQSTLTRADSAPSTAISAARRASDGPGAPASSTLTTPVLANSVPPSMALPAEADAPVPQCSQLTIEPATADASSQTAATAPIATFDVASAVADTETDISGCPYTPPLPQQLRAAALLDRVSARVRRELPARWQEPARPYQPAAVIAASAALEMPQRAGDRSASADVCARTAACVRGARRCVRCERGGQHVRRHAYATWP